MTLGSTSLLERAEPVTKTEPGPASTAGNVSSTGHSRLAVSCRSDRSRSLWPQVPRALPVQLTPLALHGFAQLALIGRSQLRQRFLTLRVVRCIKRVDQALHRSQITHLRMQNGAHNPKKLG